VANQKTSALIDSCASTFKRSGLLRLAEEPGSTAQVASPWPSVAQAREQGGSYSVLSSELATSGSTRGGLQSLGSGASIYGAVDQTPSEQGVAVFHGNVALALHEAADADPSSLHKRIPERWAGLRGAERHGETSRRTVGLRVVDDFLPDGGLPTGKVTELVMGGGAAWGTRLALWACRAAQEQAALAGTECWCAYIDPSGSLHARGVEATGVTLSRLLVLRPTMEDVERIVLRLSEARVFSVIVVDLVGVPWAIRSARSTQKASTPWSGWSAARGQKSGSKLGASEQRRQNWPRTVRQLAMRLANTQAQVILLTEGHGDAGSQGNNQPQSGGLPLPVALRVQMSSTRSGLSLHVVKEAHGRVGGQVTVPWGEWWGKPEIDETDAVRSPSRVGRAKPLGVHPERVQSLLRTVSPERQARETGIPTVASSRLARSSRASL
jgi:RecA/RadA recombinase